MIQLKTAPRPIQLTDELVKELTQKFLLDKTLRVWSTPFIIDALLKMSSEKCCYCECKIHEESKYMEIEHFLCKNLYPLEVVNWVNLLPSCKRCNGYKSNHDVHAEPIIHPVNDDPRTHLKFESYRFYSKTSIGKETIDVVKLNERVRLQKKRFEVGSEIKEKLDEHEIQTKEYLSGLQSTQKRNNILSKLKGIMHEGQPTEEYAATVATEIIREDSYHFVKTELIKLGFWNIDFQNLEDEITQIAF
jgi:uncharacterized protein (TIGR02646 family)